MNLPILFLSPHSGLSCPEELSNLHILNNLAVFIESSSGIETIFNFKNTKNSIIINNTSHLFVDTDREFNDVYPKSRNGVIKTETIMKKKIFKEDYYPDEIAISNILRRYYFPFFKEIDSEIDNNNYSMIIKCQSHMPVYPEDSENPGEPTPVIEIKKDLNNSILNKEISFIAEELSRDLSKEADTVGEKYHINDIDNSYIHEHYNDTIPVIELSISKSLFINDGYFDLNTLEINKRRLNQLSNLFEKFFLKFSKRFL